VVAISILAVPALISLQDRKRTSRRRSKGHDDQESY
jgi:hypothetical protein